MKLPNFAPDSSLNAQLYEREFDISIYCGHVHSLVEHCSSVIYQIPVSALRSRRRLAAIAEARQVAMYLANVAFGLTYTEIGRLFARDRTTVAHACSTIENARDDPIIDLTLQNLEAALTGSRRAAS